MIYYFYGSDWFKAGLEAGKLKTRLVDSGSRAVVLSPETETWLTDLKQFLQTGSIFSEKQVIIFSFEKLSASEKKELENLLNSFSSEERAVVVLEKKSKSGLKLKTAEKKEFILPGDKQIKAWERYLLDLAKDLGISLERYLINYFLSLETKEPAYFYQELLKLSLYQPGKKIGLKEFFSLNNQESRLNYFDWIKAVLKGDLAKSLVNIPADVGEGLGRLKSLINIFQILVASKDKNIQPNFQAAKKEFLDKTNPYWLRNLNHWAEGISSSEAALELKKLLELEAKIKTGRLTVQEGLKIFCLS
ncbi:MAG: DNA polymerase III subunit delta [Patescibacteria group bacterium]